MAGSASIAGSQILHMPGHPISNVIACSRTTAQRC